MKRAAAINRPPMAWPSKEKKMSLAFMMVMMVAVRKKKPAQKRRKREQMAMMASAARATKMPVLTLRVMAPNTSRSTRMAALRKTRPQKVRERMWEMPPDFEAVQVQSLL